MRFIPLILAFLVIIPAAFADEAAPVIYTKTTIKIIPKADKTKVELQPAEKKDEKEESKPTEVLPVLPRVTKEFTVEVRPIEFLGQHDFISHQPFTDKEGMMILITPPQIVALKSANLLAKVDVLFVMEDGLISQIAPNLSLPGLAEPIETEKSVHAFVFLKAGTAKESDIAPGDTLESPLFKTHPIMLEDKNK